MILRFFILIGFVLCVRSSNACQKATPEASKEGEQSPYPHKRVMDLINLDKQNFAFYRSVRKQIAANECPENSVKGNPVSQFNDNAKVKVITVGVDNEASTIR